MNPAKAIGRGLKRIGAAAVTFYRRYPSRANSYILAGVVGVAGVLGIAVDSQSAGTVIGIVVPVLIGGEATHHLVSPTKKGATQ